MSRWALPASFLALLLALAAIAPASASPPCGVGFHDPCGTPEPAPSYGPDMGVTSMRGWETQAALSDGSGILIGTASISTAQARTGVASLRTNPASGATGWAASALELARFSHFGLYVASLPSLSRVIAGQTAANTGNLTLDSTGTISVRNNTTVLGTSTTALVTGRWYWIGWLNQALVTGVLLQIDGVDQVSATTGSTVNGGLGAQGTEASAIDVYFDDIINDDAGFLPPSRVGLSVPISDVSRTDWTNDAAGTTLWSALDGAPPTGIADTTSGDGSHQVRDATNGTDTFVVNMTTYASLGLTVNDKILAVLPFAVTGAPSGTSPKAGSLTISNPTITKASFGNFYHGSTIAGTFPSGWVFRPLSATTSPTITVANSPQITVTQDTSSTRIAMMSFLGLYVAWTPGALGHITNVQQAVARAANY